MYDLCMHSVAAGTRCDVRNNDVLPVPNHAKKKSTISFLSVGRVPPKKVSLLKYFI